MRIRPSTSPSPTAAKNRSVSSRLCSGDGSNRGRRASVCLRARTPIWRVFAGVFPTTAAISSKSNPNTSCSRNTDVRPATASRAPRGTRSTVTSPAACSSRRGLVVGDDRLREPRPHVALAPHPRRAQVVDRESRRDLGEERLRLADLPRRRRAAGAHAGTSPARCPRRPRPHPPCGRRSEQQGPEPLELLDLDLAAHRSSRRDDDPGCDTTGTGGGVTHPFPGSSMGNRSEGGTS